MVREALAGLGLPDDLVYDGMTMASELATNTLHAGAEVEVDATAQWPVAGGPELWLYLRRNADGWELVCKAYDCLTGWKRNAVPTASEVASHAVSGRGMQVVAGLSGGRWGHHLTRARLGGWKVPGKVVWFAQPVPAAAIPARLLRARLAPCQGARTLETMLAGRGLGNGLLRTDEAGEGMSVLSVRCGLTVWCRADTVFWRTRAGTYQQRAITDLEEVAEQIVCLSEEMDRGIGAGHNGPARVR